MAAAYFIEHGMSLDEAIALIKRTRPFINITAPQMEALRAYAAAYGGARAGEEPQATVDHAAPDN